MSKDRLHEIMLPLEDIQELFVDPEPGSDRFVSGMDYLYGEVKVHRSVLKQSNRFKVIIELPREKITEDLQMRTNTKIKRYCKFKVEQSRKELIVLRHQGIEALRRSIWVALICIVLGIGATAWSQSGINSVLEAVLLFIVAFCVLGAGWVAVWMPFEYFLYDGWPFQHDIRVYNHIADANIVIRTHRDEVSEHVGDAEVVQDSELS